MQLFSAVANSKDPTRQKIINFADIVGVICLSGKVSASGAVAANFACGSLIAASAVTSSCRPRPVPPDTAHGQVRDAALAWNLKLTFSRYGFFSPSPPSLWTYLMEAPISLLQPLTLTLLFLMPPPPVIRKEILEFNVFRKGNILLPIAIAESWTTWTAAAAPT